MIDTIIFLKLGHKVIACEHSKVLYKLLEDAISRASKEYDFFENLIFLNADSSNTINLHQNSDIFYFDPMFNKTKRNLKRSGTLQKISNILSYEELEDTSKHIFNSILKKDFKKIIVKRPINSKPLHNKTNYQIKGKAIRFDIYVKSISA